MPLFLEEWVPKRIVNKPQDQAGTAIESTYWRELWSLVIEQGDDTADALKRVVDELFLTAWHPTDAAASISNPELFPGGDLDVSSQLTELKAHTDKVISDLMDTAWHPIDGASSIRYPAIYPDGAIHVGGQLTELYGDLDTAKGNIAANTAAISQRRLLSVALDHNNASDISGTGAANSHPISAITGLQAALDDISAGEIGAFSHNDIGARDVADAHPLAAITGLQTALNTIPTTHASFADRNNTASHIAGAIQYASGVSVATKIANMEATIASITGDIGELSHNDISGLDAADAHPQSAITGLVTALAGKEPTISLTASRALVSNTSGKTAVSAVTSTELGYVSGVTSALQTQLNGKQGSITGGATTIATSNLTASRALISNSSGKVAVSAVTDTQLGYVAGVTSAIQTQLDSKQRNITASTANPSGGSNGDVWIKYA